VKRSWSDRIWRDKDGKVVIAQAPNIPILGWAACAVASRLLDDGIVATGVSELGRAFLFTWAYLEITAGVNLFRRGLGAVMLAAVIVGFFSS